MSVEQIEITVEIVCTKLPGAGSNDLQLGIQHDEAITELASADSRRIVFKASLRARRNDDGSVNFLGPFAQGPKAERFIYLNWVAKNAEGVLTQIGRLKLHLNHIEWAQVEQRARAKKPLRVQLALTNAKGSHLLASVRPDLAQWT